MIRNIIKKDTFILSYKECEEILNEIYVKKWTISALIKEYSIEVKDLDEWNSSSPLPLLCETFVSLLRLYELFHKLTIKYLGKNEVRLTESDVFVYETYYKNLELYRRELKHLYFIAINANDGNN